ncbi:quinoprotein relay system zinc metallohydrolase 1 [Croceicoccus ponticola]|uniref:Quinoprotein relay system zinc metallohydrolase 1 n=1 Tax=Croceicoccus ponticola TaxID=2217664 RepID=A0A437GVV6_9SPHN|nr:quinoprotein relay system zinc metallohydrolase 1 [Croceicoccus ponticola]RVQ66015.1 quinoprotein relay system zinc metallohydrolase 1 [Croceicoccus ponticola]
MNLNRRSVLTAALAGGVLVSKVGRTEAFARGYDPQAEAIADGVWLVRGKDEPIAFDNGGAIANSVFIATDAGTVLIDPGPSLAYGKALSALAQRVTGAAVARVYITHLHPDHSFGAAAFDPAIAHALPATRHDLVNDGDGFSDALYRMLADWMSGTAVVLPQGDAAEGNVTFGGRTLRLFAMNGHSNGDLAILDQKTGTLIAGDLLFHDRAPATPHADIDGWLAALDRIEGISHRLLIPGHGPLDRNGTSIAQTRDWLTWLRASLRNAVPTGKDMSEAGAMTIPDRFAGLKVARYELQRSVSHFYPGLEAELLPEIGR